MAEFNNNEQSNCISGWKAVEKNLAISWDLEGTPLQIKTDSAMGSGDQIALFMSDKDSGYIGYLNVLFYSTVESTMTYQFGYCADWTYLPVQPPEEMDKIWTITKTETALIIICNEVEVLNYLFADSSDSRCGTEWGRDVEKIMFDKESDKASDFYRAGKSLDLIRYTLRTDYNGTSFLYRTPI